MANPIPAPVGAVPVGGYFVNQYYHVLQQQPDFVHQFYTDSSTMIRVDRDTVATAATMLEIHSLIMALNFKGIEIKTAHSLDSWNGGVLVMVSGSVQTEDLQWRRKFFQTFFLAPQPKGYFVLNDIFHFLDEEHTLHHPAEILVHGNFDSQLNATNSLPVPEPDSDYMPGGEIQSREFVASTHGEGNDTVDDYGFEEQQHVSEANSLAEESPTDDSTNATFSPPINTVRDTPPAPMEEHIGEPPKQTYASILRVAKGPSLPVVSPPQAFSNKGITVSMESHYMSQSTTAQQSHLAAAAVLEKNIPEAVEEIVAVEEGEGKSIYVRNLPSTVSVSDVEQEFQSFGRIKPDGVVVRNRKDIGVCYAFIKYEDAVAVQNAIKASPIQFGGRQVHVEERRANSSSASRGGRRGRGRGGYQMDSGRGRAHFGSRSFGRGSRQDGDYNSRPRGNGFQQRGPRQEEGSWEGME